MQFGISRIRKPAGGQAGSLTISLPAALPRRKPTVHHPVMPAISNQTAVPSLETVRSLGDRGRYVPIYRRLLSDSITPVAGWCRLQSGGPSFLFESVVGGEKVGRFSFVGSDPLFLYEARGTTVTVTKGDHTESFDAADPLDDVQSRLDEFSAVHLPELPRFCGGAVGYFGYDTVRYVEHLPNAPTDDRGLPDISLGFYDQMVIFDHISKVVLVVVHVDSHAKDLEREYERANDSLNSVVDRLRSSDGQLDMLDIASTGESSLEWTSNFTRDEFEAVVERGKEYIRAGDVFQFVPSQRLHVETKAEPLDIYRALRVVNPSPFMFLLETPSCTLVGASPEIMTRVEKREVTIRPLAGTRKRGATEEEDRALEEDLLADEKERAEHVMLVDLARNDVGRVAKFGSVRIDEVMVVERYSHVMHISSSVSGELRPEFKTIDALKASLPAGTLSGAPKVRAMEIIDEFEPHRRGPYGGAVGYIDFTGNMDLCIALRTLVMQGRDAYVQAGCGVVADSVPALEYEETINKAQGLLRAIEIAETQLCEHR